MKVFAVERLWDEWQLTREELDNYELAPPTSFPVTMCADSALVRRGMPMFVPDFATDKWKIHLQPYVVTSRLGKSIPCRFAERYYDSIGLAARLLPPQIERPDRHLNALTASFDGAIAPGPTMPIATLAGEDGALNISVGNELMLTINIADLHINETVSFLSRYMIMKTGDIILLCDTAITLPAKIGSTIDANINGQPLLNVRLK